MTVSIDAARAPETQSPGKPEDAEKIIQNLERVLRNRDGQEPLHRRFRALFALMNVGTDDAVNAIGRALDDPSALLKHELAYVLGQMGRRAAVPVLSAVLENTAEEAMVRHEAAEALGAIGDEGALPLLETFQRDSELVVAQTCELAVAKIRYDARQRESKGDAGPYRSVDPAPPMSVPVSGCGASAASLQGVLMDATLPLFDRYRAMFSLRNLGTEEAVLALAAGFGDASALFRHEIAYVFGQLQHAAAVPALVAVLENLDETPMVRHEAAEALGSIATPACRDALERFSDDLSNVVRESCQVGLDMWAHENGGLQEYAISAREALEE